ncbi:MAG: hypothetical protein AAFO04_28465 [Cyanobacteria bacterium J06592_8]
MMITMSFETVFDNLVYQWMEIQTMIEDRQSENNPNQDILIGADRNGVLVGGKNNDLLTDKGNRYSV